MLIPIILQARDQASATLRTVQSAFKGINQSASEAAKSANIKINPTGQDKVNELKKQIDLTTNSLKLQSAQENVRKANAAASVAQIIANEKRLQNESKNTEKSRQALARAEQNLLSARNRVASANQKLGLLNLKADYAKEKDALGSIGDKGSSVFGKLKSGAGEFNLLLGAGMLGAAGIAIGALSSVFGEFNRQLDNARKNQTQKIINTTQVQLASGLSRTQSREEINKFDKDLRRESEGIVDLTYSKRIGYSFLDDYIKNYTKSGESIDTARKDAATTANNIAAISSFTGVDYNQLQNVLGDVTAGQQSLDVLRGRDALNDTGINKVLIPKLEKLGIKEINDSNRTEVLKALKESTAAIYSGDTKREILGTFEGMVKVTQNKLFGEDGIFSITRVLLPDGSQKDTVFASLTQTFQALFGANGLMAQIGTSMSQLFPNRDPMVELKKAIDDFNIFIQAVTNGVKVVTAKLQEIANSDLFKQFSSATDLLPRNGESILRVDGNGVSSDFGSRVAPRIAPAIPSIITDVLTGGIFGGLVPKYRGTPNIFSASNGFLGAMRDEVKNKPYGSGLVIANTSETVLTPDQMAALTNRQSSTIVRPVSFGNIIINALPGMDLNALADLVINRIDSDIENAMSNNLA